MRFLSNRDIVRMNAGNDFLSCQTVFYSPDLIKPVRCEHFIRCIFNFIGSERSGVNSQPRLRFRLLDLLPVHHLFRYVCRSTEDAIILSRRIRKNSIAIIIIPPTRLTMTHDDEHFFRLIIRIAGIQHISESLQ